MLFAVLLAAAGASGAQVTPPGKSSGSHFASEEGRYSIDFPAKPSADTVQSFGGEFHVMTAQVGEVEYSAGWRTLDPEKASEATLDRDFEIIRGRYSDVGQVPVEIPDGLERSWSYRDGDRSFEKRDVLRWDRAYALVVSWPTSGPEPKDVGSFMDSFTLNTFDASTLGFSKPSNCDERVCAPVLAIIHGRAGRFAALRAGPSRNSDGTTWAGHWKGKIAPRLVKGELDCTVDEEKRDAGYTLSGYRCLSDGLSLDDAKGEFSFLSVTLSATFPYFDELPLPQDNVPGDRKEQFRGPGYVVTLELTDLSEAAMNANDPFSGDDDAPDAGAESSNADWHVSLDVETGGR